MQLFISVLRPGEADAAARDLLVVAPEDATVGDMVAGLEPAVEGSAPGAALRLVVNAGEQVGAPPLGVWDGPRRLAPADNLVDVVRNGMLLAWADRCATTPNRWVSSSCAWWPARGPAPSTA